MATLGGFLHDFFNGPETKSNKDGSVKEIYQGTDTVIVRGSDGNVRERVEREYSILGGEQTVVYDSDNNIINVQQGWGDYEP